MLQSIDPGQQFTWEHSNLEVNKPKNRYANVIAYDHSRVILLPIEGRSSPTASRAAMGCAGSAPVLPHLDLFPSLTLPGVWQAGGPSVNQAFVTFW